MKCYVVILRYSWKDIEPGSVKDIHLTLEPAMAQARRLIEKESERKGGLTCENFSYKNGSEVGWGVINSDGHWEARAFVLERTIVASPLQILAGSIDLA